MSEYAKNVQTIEDMWKKRIELREEGGGRMSMQTCHATQANYEHCKYSTNRGWCDTSRYAELFGTPERAARTLTHNTPSTCDECVLIDVCDIGMPATCMVDDRDALLEWLRGDA